MKAQSLLSATGIVVVALGAGWLIGTWRNTPAPSTKTDGPRVSRGVALYTVYCATCHGPDGHGDGSFAGTLRPPPRDFADRPWRTEPTPEAIRRVCLEGLPGTAMPSFKNTLPAADLEAVVAHVHHLALSGPPLDRAGSGNERLLRSAGFTPQLGLTPPPLRLSDAAGQGVRLKAFAGRLVLLHFWGTGCTHCINEMPALNALAKRYPGRLEVLHICTDEEDAAAAQATLDKLVPGTRALVESAGIGLARYEVQTLPTLWLIAPDGTAIARVSGRQDWESAPVLRILQNWLPGEP